MLSNDGRDIFEWNTFEWNGNLGDCLLLINNEFLFVNDTTLNIFNETFAIIMFVR